MDTIFAQATAAGRAGVSVVRISGPLAFEVAQDLSGPLPQSHIAALRTICDSEGVPIDKGLVLPFAGPNSFTGEDVVELHLHGSVAIVQAVLSRLSEYKGCRIADAGEFTRRALENQKLDLAQVEGLADLIEAETEAQRKQALNVLTGRFGDLVEGWRSDLIRAAALLEATIDFADEDVPVDVTPEVSAILARVAGQLTKEIDGSKIAERISAGFEVAIVGAPNAGKSTLLNALAGREAAITSEIAGTTRDIVEVRMDLGGLAVTLLDTAGLRDSDDTIEVMGIERAIQRAEGADLRVFLTFPDEQLPVDMRPQDIKVHPKADLYPEEKNAISGITSQGIDDLINQITRTLAQLSGGAGLATRERHRVAMIRAKTNIVEVERILLNGVEQYDIASEELRSGVRQLESLIGRIGVENLLDEIFSSFCIGK
ncbi:tRNA modification GTPase MnmE [Sulfitobacter noctilucae]|uniref:tRNA uridine-5-carboxymethylaminomethyl(34) synthesis GTPase MnmE n=1 Tax=Sulfitobacter noctilucae TaxID=1342302 RepID=UPI00046A6FB8|nr:tRNA uridine-5-carboxymethylaminomethyl(34) synthesis GTPase MnmE [Sulfitobacter noctilucae]KIN65746.1 tRNA modification GTPase MnmE [Sulfitobacter noctilucae]